ncbi:MAG: hypothetical protein F4X02_01725 [Chloroflexi bacterium]|nr:hypothetical protein [Chloroflexota bacterium]
MFFVLVILVNILVMGALFAFGVYQFMQVEAKRKCRRLLAEAALDAGELGALIQAERYDEALSRLMRQADVDRFTAEATLEQLGRDGESSRAR